MKVPVYCWRSSFARPNPGGFIMRFLTATAASYVGVDLHARTLFVCVLDQAGAIKLSRNLPAKPQPFLNAVEPFLPDLVVGCECMHSWYWLADTCRAHNIPFALGHAFGIKAVHASKTKSDAHDAEVLARLLRDPLLALTRIAHLPVHLRLDVPAAGRVQGQLAAVEPQAEPKQPLALVPLLIVLTRLVLRLA